MAEVVSMEKRELFLRCVEYLTLQNSTGASLGRLLKRTKKPARVIGFLCRAEKASRARSFLLRNSKALSGQAKELLEQLINALLYQEAVDRLGDRSDVSEGRIGFLEAMKRLGVDPREATSLIDAVEFE